MTRIDILYEDDETLVLNKPAGLAVQGGAGIKTSLDSILAEQWQPTPLLVHRLDKDTSGLILTAKGAEAAAYYSSIISGRAVQKLYLAVCAVKNETSLAAQGTISDSIVVKGRTKTALTGYRLLDTSGGFALYELALGTGRMHQIRRHLALNGYPIVGDDKYGDFALNKKIRAEKGHKRLLLHAWKLAFTNKKGKILEIEATLPEYFKPFMP